MYDWQGRDWGAGVYDWAKFGVLKLNRDKKQNRKIMEARLEWAQDTASVWSEKTTSLYTEIREEKQKNAKLSEEMESILGALKESMRRKDEVVEASRAAHKQLFLQSIGPYENRACDKCGKTEPHVKLCRHCYYTPNGKVGSTFTEAGWDFVREHLLHNCSCGNSWRTETRDA